MFQKYNLINYLSTIVFLPESFLHTGHTLQAASHSLLHFKQSAANPLFSCRLAALPTDFYFVLRFSESTPKPQD